jgi:predicted DNA-binding protein
MKEAKEKTERLNVDIPAEQYARLRKLSAREERTITVLVRRALAAYLDAEEKKK